MQKITWAPIVCALEFLPGGAGGLATGTVSSTDKVWGVYPRRDRESVQAGDAKRVSGITVCGCVGGGEPSIFHGTACPVLNAVQELFFNTTPGNPLDPDLSIIYACHAGSRLHDIVVCVVEPVRDGRFVAPRHMFFVKITF